MKSSWSKSAFEYLCICVLALSLLILTVCLYLYYNFGLFDLRVIPEFIDNGIKETPTIYLVTAGAAFSCYLVSLGLLVYFFSKLNYRKRIISYVTACSMCFVSGYVFSYLYFSNITSEAKTVDMIIDNFTTKEKTNFVNRYYVNGQYSVPLNKKNVVLVIVESMEKTFGCKDVFKESIIPEIDRLQEENVNITGNGRFLSPKTTKDGIVSILTGIPLCAGFDKEYQNNVVLKTNSVSKILAKHGYVNSVVMSSNESFTTLNEFYKTHAFSKITDFTYLAARYPEAATFQWGIDDAYTYRFALEEYKALSNGNKPFFLLVNTIDTHEPTMARAETKEKYDGSRISAFRDASIYLNDFINGMRAVNDLDNTVVIVLGDHLFREGSVAITETVLKNFKDLKGREIVNFIIDKDMGKRVISKNYSSFDMAPTILDVIGFKVTSDRFGIGTSLLSDKDSIIKNYTDDEIYNKFFKCQDISSIEIKEF